MSFKSLTLAYQSPRRAELLRQIRVNFSVQTSDIDESPMTNEPPMAYLHRMTESKARAVQSSLNFDQQNSSPVIIAADTIGDLDGEVLIKPRDRDDALAILQRMSARCHTVATGVCVLSGDKCDYVEVKTQVRFRALSEQEILRYWDSGEPRDKAGAYGIQGLGAAFVENIKGSYSNVVGLPLCETTGLLKNAEVAF